jgi:predicted PurR-regulated permease PerM
MRKLTTKGFIVVFGLFLVIFNFVINKYDFFPVIKSALLPVIIGFVIAYLVDPMVKFIMKLSKGKIKRGFSILISIILVLSMITLFGAVLIPSIISSVEDIIVKITKLVENPSTLEFFEKALNQIDSELFAEVVEYVNGQLQTIMVKVGELSTFLLNGLASFLGSAITSLFSFFMAFVISIYMLADKKDLLHRIKRVNYAFNDVDTADTLLRITKKSNDIFSSFFVGKIIDSAIIGVLCFIIMALFKIPNAPAIGFIVGLTNIIPYFGPFIGAVPAVLVTLASGSLFQVLLVLIIIVALQQFDGLYLGPKILGDKIGVGAFWIIVSVSVGGALFGVVGMFVGVPVVVLIKTLIEEYVDIKLKEKKFDI